MEQELQYIPVIRTACRSSAFMVLWWGR